MPKYDGDADIYIMFPFGGIKLGTRIRFVSMTFFAD